MPDQDTILLERTYAAPIDRVWRTISDAELLSQWLMPCDFEPTVGHAFTFRTTPYPGFDGVVHCRVLALEAPVLLSFSWSGGPLVDTVVTFRLTELDEGRTQLELSHSGFGGYDQIRRMLLQGWESMFDQRLSQTLDA